MYTKKVLDTTPHDWSKKILMVFIRLLNKEEITLGNSLGGGGEGKIYEVEGESSLVAKIYHRTS